MRIDRRQCGLDIGRLHHPRTGILERGGDIEPNQRFILDHEDQGAFEFAVWQASPPGFAASSMVRCEADFSSTLEKMPAQKASHCRHNDKSRARVATASVSRTFRSARRFRDNRALGLAIRGDLS